MAFITFSLIFGLIGFYEGVEKGHSDRAQIEADIHHENTANYIAESCTNRQPPTFEECIEKAIKTSGEYQRAEKDLTAQYNMSQWARWLLGLTALSTAVTAFGVWLVKRTLDQGAEINQAAIDAANAATEANRIIREEKRPWLRIESYRREYFESSESSTGYRYRDIIRVENKGLSPAINVGFAISDVQDGEQAAKDKVEFIIHFARQHGRMIEFIIHHESGSYPIKTYGDSDPLIAERLISGEAAIVPRTCIGLVYRGINIPESDYSVGAIFEASGVTLENERLPEGTVRKAIVEFDARSETEVLN